MRTRSQNRGFAGLQRGSWGDGQEGTQGDRSVFEVLKSALSNPQGELIVKTSATTRLPVTILLVSTNALGVAGDGLAIVQNLRKAV